MLIFQRLGQIKCRSLTPPFLGHGTSMTWGNSAFAYR